MISVAQPAELKACVGQTHLCPLERRIDAQLLQSFSAISQDYSAIHSVGEHTVVPGNLLICLLPAMLQSGLHVAHFRHCKTVSLKNLRFRHSVGLQETLQLRYQLVDVRTQGEQSFVSAELELLRRSDNKRVMQATQCDCYRH